ncbi:sucrose phosphorylase [Nocardioides sp. YIM 152315]|uniref:sucrose phosphorylase n=1 Tax=Nocardioides sp. YIM 152315 TaxID=3031760 RepID=UPI0023DA6C78|nr:sucrose phosphorylase [Nocardioides sp. YIM 152315]MDF1605784.1 sucrose phosphorylase [Nocardioides sp. YIM 152315]
MSHTDRPEARHGVHLLAYADRFGGDLAGLRRLLTEGPLAVFEGVHVLPFFTPYDGADAGFDPVDHTVVDPRLGDWSDVQAMRDGGLDVTADVIVNHVSADSAEFRDWLARGADSPHAGMFLTFDTVFPEGGTEAGITAFYRPRAGLPFTPYQMGDGTRRLVWTTFLPSQVDLDVRHPVARDHLVRVMGTLAEGGVRTVRLDAVGYAVKTAGTDSFMTDETLSFVEEITALAHEQGLEVLVEVHAHHSQQAAVAARTDLVYDFALPPLLLHALETGETARLEEWLRVRPQNAITVLDTHDGIGVVDAGPAREWPGLMDDDDMRAVFDAAARRTDGESARASTAVAWAALPHQVNSTFYSVLGEDDEAYLLARAFQLFTPGRPQVYYVGLLAGSNDVDLFRATGVGREINRHRYSTEEIEAALDRDVVRRQLGLIRARGEHPAFAGTFACAADGHGVLVLTWTRGEHRAELRADLARRTFDTTFTATGA